MLTFDFSAVRHLTTERLVLRKLGAQDVEAIFL